MTKNKSISRRYQSDIRVTAFCSEASATVVRCTPIFCKSKYELEKRQMVARGNLQWAVFLAIAVQINSTN